jgi:hypothetical protein
MAEPLHSPSGPAAPRPAPIVRQRSIRKLSEELAILQARAGSRSVTLREVIYVLGGRAYTLLILLLALPFITPVPMLGLSTPFGLAIALIALRLTFGRRPWLPKKFQRKQLPAAFFEKLFLTAGKILRLFEKFLRPRVTVLVDTPLLRQLHAALIVLAALALLLPLPIPLTNSFPAWTILLIAAGLLERDGAFILAGYVIFAAGVLYFVFLGEATARSLEALWTWLRNLF